MATIEITTIEITTIEMAVANTFCELQFLSHACVFDEQKTRASHHLVDDVSSDVKRRRHEKLVETFRQCSLELNKSMVGRQTVVLVETVS